jgi:phage-related protein
LDRHYLFLYGKKRNTNLAYRSKKGFGIHSYQTPSGETVGSPDVKSMTTIDQGCFEIRLRSIDGIYRAFYILKTDVGILIFHSFKKKSQKTPLYELNTGRKRLRSLLQELLND